MGRPTQAAARRFGQALPTRTGRQRQSPGARLFSLAFWYAAALEAPSLPVWEGVVIGLTRRGVAGRRGGELSGVLECVQQRSSDGREHGISEHCHKYPADQFVLDALDFHFEPGNLRVEFRIQ